MSAEWSLIQTWERPADVGTAAAPFVELYNRRTDAAERRNVAADPANREVRAKLEKEILRHLQSLGLPGRAR